MFAEITCIGSNQEETETDVNVTENRYIFILCCTLKLMIVLCFKENLDAVTSYIFILRGASVMNAPCYPYSIVIFKGFYLYLMQ